MKYYTDCKCNFCAGERAKYAQRLEELLALARKAYDALTPDKRATSDRAQRISWVKGTLMLGGVGEELAEELAEALAKTAVRQAEK